MFTKVQRSSVPPHSKQRKRKEIMDTPDEEIPRWQAAMMLQMSQDREQRENQFKIREMEVNEERRRRQEERQDELQRRKEDREFEEKRRREENEERREKERLDREASQQSFALMFASIMKSSQNNSDRPN